jgi:hypothetical protein
VKTDKTWSLLSQETSNTMLNDAAADTADHVLLYEKGIIYNVDNIFCKEG